MPKKYLVPVRTPEERNKIVEQNLNLVPFAFKLLAKRSSQLAKLGWEEATAAGYAGLVEAADYWVPEKGKFSTYAIYYLRKWMYGAAAQKLVHIPDRGRRPLSKRPLRPLPMVRYLSPDYDKAEKDRDGPAPTIADYCWEEMRTLLNLLSPRLRVVIELHYFQGRSRKSIAAELGLTRQAVSERIHRAHRNLRHWAKTLEIF